MAEIAELIAADNLHIMRWQVRLSELRRQGDPGSGPALHAAWDTLAVLIDLHMAAEDEVCGPAIAGTGPRGPALARQARDAHQDIREILREAGEYPPGSPLWWQLAAEALAAWTRYLHWQVYGPLADYRQRTAPGLRARLACQWRAFMDARIRDQYPDPPPQVPTCQLRQAWTAATVPQLADPAFAAIACICPSCTLDLERAYLSPPAPTRTGTGGCAG